MRHIRTRSRPGIASRIGCAMLVMAPLLTSCGTSGHATDFAWTRPIYISRADVLTDGTAREILVHNETGGEMCGWK